MNWALGTRVSCAKTAEPIGMSLGSTQSRGTKEPRTRWVQSPHGQGDGTRDGPLSTSATVQGGNAALRQITFDTSLHGVVR